MIINVTLLPAPPSGQDSVDPNAAHLIASLGAAAAAAIWLVMQ